MNSHFVPIIWLGGEAGSGKDTIGSFIASAYNGVCVAQTDPMKRFAAEVFGFDEDQLWGPSRMRNQVDQRTVVDRDTIWWKFGAGPMRELIYRVVPLDVDRTAARADLQRWFRTLCKDHLSNGIPVSPRFVLQTLGTQWGRSVSKDMWSLYAIETGLKLLGGGWKYSPQHGLISADDFRGYDFVAITDGRFRNEALNVRMRGGVALSIFRPNTDRAAVESAGMKDHASEKELRDIPRHFYNEMLVNNGSLRDLTMKVSEIFRHYYGT